LHNSQFLVAHFHNVIIPGVLFGILAGIHIWFPKIYGFRLMESLSRTTAFLWAIGFILAFMPLYQTGMMGMTRRTVAYEDPALVPWMIVSGIGSLILGLAFLFILLTIFVSVLNRKKLAVPFGDPWDGRTLEWWTPAPTPDWNFAVLPKVDGRDAFADAKEKGTAYQPIEKYDDIEMPANTYYGFIIMVMASGLGFGLVWHMWWLAIASLLGAIATAIIYAFLPQRNRIIPAAEVREIDEAWRRAARESVGVTRDDEGKEANKGLARPDIIKNP
jgi:cytochrome o ubiquinol oxidase subunit 1